MDLVWDLRVLPVGKIEWDIVGTAMESPKAWSSVTQAIDTSGGGFMQIKMLRVQIHDEAGHRAWLHLRNWLNGGVGRLVVPLLNDIIAPGRIRDIPFSDGSRHSDGTGHQASTLIAEVAAAAPLSAGTIQILVRSGRTISWPDVFAIRHPTRDWRIYNIREVDDVTTTADGIVYTVGIRPTLREAITAGAVVDFHRPRCLMRLQAGKTMPWAPEKYWTFTPDVTFIEAMR